jgi:hypothetical protein
VLQGYLKKVLTEESTVAASRDPNRKDIAEMVRKVKDQMKHVWNDAQNFGVSNEVLMVEVEVIQRLVLDRLLPAPAQIENTIRFLRRSSLLKHHFASCVGKRMLTERLISRGRTSIIEHHRSVAWGEREYKAFYDLCQLHKNEISQSQKTVSKDYQQLFTEKNAEVRKDLISLLGTN